MDFSSALNGLKRGHSLTRASWPTESSVKLETIGDGELKSLKFSGTDKNELALVDLLASDWELI